MKGDSWTPFLPHPFTLWRLFLDCPVFGLRKCRDRENNQPTPPKTHTKQRAHARAQRATSETSDQLKIQRNP